MQENKPALEKVRLKKFFVIVRFFAFSVVAVVALLFIFKIELFPFITRPSLFLALLSGITLFSVLFYFFVVPRSTKKSVLYINNVAWAIFLVAVLYATGSAWSPWSIVLLFPIITTAFDLEAAAALVVGILIIALVGILTLLDTNTPGAISLGLFLMFYLALYTFYIYRIIKETLRHKYEKEETKRKYGELLEIDRAKTNFITVASHQLRTPLTEIKWAINTLIQEKINIPAESRSILEKSGEGIDRLIGIVNEMLRVPLLEHPESLLEKSTVDVKELLEEIIRGLALLAKQKNVSVSLTTEGALNIFADREKIKVSLENIIDNALRYSPNGSVTIEAGKGAQNVAIAVKDTGIGIAPEDQDRLFTKFFRGKNAMLLEPNESGVGLFIAKAIIDKHGGTVTFSSKLGQGTAFKIVLPAGIQK